MSEAFIYDAVRTPRGKNRGGALHSVKPIDLVTGLIDAVRERNPDLDDSQLLLEIDSMHEEAAACLRDELGALTYSEVRARATRARIRKFVLHARAVGWFVWRYKAAKARVDFAPGGTGAQKAAAEFASVAATEAATDDDVPQPPRKRQRTS